LITSEKRSHVVQVEKLQGQLLDEGVVNHVSAEGDHASQDGEEDQGFPAELVGQGSGDGGEEDDRHGGDPLRRHQEVVDAFLNGPFSIGIHLQNS
jgi:hypothetical protein